VSRGGIEDNCGKLPQNSVGSGTAGGRGTGGTVGRGSVAGFTSKDGHEFFNLVGVAVRAKDFTVFRNREK